MAASARDSSVEEHVVGPLALAYLTVHGAEPIEQIDAAAANGFDAVGLRFAEPTGRPPPFPVVGDAAHIGRIRRACADAGVAILDVEMIVIDKALDPAATAPLFEAAAEVGARFVQVVCEDEDMSRTADKLAALASLAEAHRLQLALEFVPFRSIRTLAEAVAAIERSRGDNVGVLVDTLHFDRSGGRPADLDEIDPGRIAYVQLCDAPKRRPAADRLLVEARTGRLYPGEGALPLGQVLHRMPPGKAISIEVPHRAHSGLGVRERARKCAQATRAFMDAREGAA